MVGFQCWLCSPYIIQRLWLDGVVSVLVEQHVHIYGRLNVYGWLVWFQCWWSTPTSRRERMSACGAIPTRPPGWCGHVMDTSLTTTRSVDCCRTKTRHSSFRIPVRLYFCRCLSSHSSASCLVTFATPDSGINADGKTLFLCPWADLPCFCIGVRLCPQETLLCCCYCWECMLDRVGQNKQRQ